MNWWCRDVDATVFGFFHVCRHSSKTGEALLTPHTFENILRLVRTLVQPMGLPRTVSATRVPSVSWHTTIHRRPEHVIPSKFAQFAHLLQRLGGVAGSWNTAEMGSLLLMHFDFAVP